MVGGGGGGMGSHSDPEKRGGAASPKLRASVCSLLSLIIYVKYILAPVFICKVSWTGAWK